MINEKSAVCTVSDIITELLNKNISVKMKISGKSMIPMMYPDCDSVKLIPIVNEDIAKDDVVLYRRNSGQLVLHRVWRVYEDKVDCIGDAQIAIEKGVLKASVMAKVIEFSRRGVSHCINDKRYIMYCKIWRISKPFRRVLIKFFYRNNR